MATGNIFQTSWLTWLLSCGPLFILSCNPVTLLRGHSVLLLTGQFKVCVNWRAELTGDRQESSDRLVPEGGGPENRGNCLWIGCVWGKGRGLGKLYGRKRGWEIDCTAVHRHTNIHIEKNNANVKNGIKFSSQISRISLFIAQY